MPRDEEPSHYALAGLFLASTSALLIFGAVIHFWYEPKFPTMATSVAVASETTAQHVDPLTEDTTNVPPYLQAMVSELKGDVEQKSPTEAFVDLRAAVAKQASLQKDCHFLTHIIGDTAIDKYATFAAAMKYNDYFCGGGYVHSLLEGVLTNTDDPATAIAHICDGQDGYCYHGIGHGLMFYTLNNVPQALSYCATLDTSEHAARCSEGVYMQNFETIQAYPTPFVYTDDPLKLCRQETTFKPACYHYAGAFLAEQWKTQGPNVFALCNAADPDYVSKCVSGMGAYFQAIHLDDPLKGEAMCDQASDSATEAACIDGVVSYHLVNFNSIPKTQQLCSIMKAKDKPACQSALKSRQIYYE